MSLTSVANLNLMPVPRLVVTVTVFRLGWQASPPGLPVRVTLTRGGQAEEFHSRGLSSGSNRTGYHLRASLSLIACPRPGPGPGPANDSEVPVSTGNQNNLNMTDIVD